MPWDVQVRLRRLLLPLLSWRQMRLPSQQASLFPSMGADMPCAQDEKLSIKTSYNRTGNSSFANYLHQLGTYAKEFKGKCYKCDRAGHRKPDCTHTTKADGSPISNNSTPTHALDTTVPKEVDQSCLDVIELSLFDVVDPWAEGADPWIPEIPPEQMVMIC